jgi:hypothetical protein
MLGGASPSLGLGTENCGPDSGRSRPKNFRQMQRCADVLQRRRLRPYDNDEQPRKAQEDPSVNERRISFS